MVALVSNRMRFDEKQNSSDGQSAHVDWWQKGWHAFVEWLTEPISFPGKWPACNPSQQRYNRDTEAMIQSSNNSLADVQ
jgi:hypothetical protein